MIESFDLNCREMLDFLDRYLEGTLAVVRRKRFDRHLASCEPCRRYLRQYQLTIRIEQQAFAPEQTHARPLCDAPEELIGAILAACTTR